MKPHLNLARVLSALFGFLRGLTFIGGLFQIILCIVYPLYHITVLPSQMIAYVDVHGAGLSQITNSTATDAEVELTELKGTLEVKKAHESPAFSSLIRWQFLLCDTPGFVFRILLFGLLRRLCANAEKGEIFSIHNTTLVRNVGITILGYQAASIIGDISYASIANRFVHRYVSTEGLQIGIRWSQFGLPQSASLIVTGFLVLLLAEVFRQGLALKSENELTV